MIFLFNSGSSLIYGMTFLTLLPQYQCIENGDWVSCDSERICNEKLEHGIQWKIDYNSQLSYHNWVDPTKIDLTCTESHLIGLMGSMYFLRMVLVLSGNAQLVRQVW